MCFPLGRIYIFQNRLPVPVLKIRADVRFYVCPKRGRRDDEAFLGCFLEVAETRKIVILHIIKDVEQKMKISMPSGANWEVTFGLPVHDREQKQGARGYDK